VLTTQLEIWLGRIEGWRRNAGDGEDLATLAEIRAMSAGEQIEARVKAAFHRGEQAAFDRLADEIQAHRDRLDRQKRAGM